MKIYAKTALESAEIQEKVNCGCDALEYQLMSDFLEYEEDFIDEELLRLIRMKDVRVVHAPIYKNGLFMTMESILLHRDIAPLCNVFKLAQKCGEIWKHRVIVILHCALSYEDFLDYELLQDQIKEKMGKLLQEHPLVDVGIENVIPLEYKNQDDVKYLPKLCNGCYLDIIYIVEKMQEQFGNRIGSVLDICHAGMFEKYMGLIIKEAEFDITDGERYRFDYSLENFFRNYKNSCKLIHYNTFENNGFGKNHGTGFRTKKEAMDVIRLYEKYGYDVPLTIEIREDDYNDCVNYREQKKWLDILARSVS